MSWLSKSVKKLGNSLKKAPGKLLTGKPLVTGVFKGVPVVGKALGKVESSAGLVSNVLGNSSLGKKLQPIEAKGGQVVAAAFGAGAIVGLTKTAAGQPAGSTSMGLGSGDGLGSGGGWLSDLAGYAQDAQNLIAAGQGIYNQVTGGGAPPPAFPGGVTYAPPSPAAPAQSGEFPWHLVLAAGGIVGAYFILKRK
jgi:hypothetical protein